MREIVNALMYLAAAACAWRLLPKDFPPFSTVQKYFYRWRDEGVLEIISHRLVAAAREPRRCARGFSVAGERDGTLNLKPAEESGVFSSQMADQIFKASDLYIIDVRFGYYTMTYYRR